MVLKWLDLSMIPGGSYVLLTGIRDRSSIELKDNTVIVVLGASGDLAKKKTVCSDAPLKD